MAFGIDLVLCIVFVLGALVVQEYVRTSAAYDPEQHYERGESGVPQFYSRFLESVNDKMPEPVLLKYAVNREPMIALSIILFGPWALGLIGHVVFGRSIGKVLMGLRTYTASGQRISAGKASVRYFGKWLSAIPAFLGYFMAFAGGKALHDRFNGTMVGKA